MARNSAGARTTPRIPGEKDRAVVEAALLNDDPAEEAIDRRVGGPLRETSAPRRCPDLDEIELETEAEDADDRRGVQCRGCGTTRKRLPDPELLVMPLPRVRWEMLKSSGGLP
jgi:hypothetical protein